MATVAGNTLSDGRCRVVWGCVLGDDGHLHVGVSKSVSNLLTPVQCGAVHLVHSVLVLCVDSLVNAAGYGAVILVEYANTFSGDVPAEALVAGEDPAGRVIQGISGILDLGASGGGDSVGKAFQVG